MDQEGKKPHQKPTLMAYWDEISKLAEEISKKRVASNIPGDQISDWFQAENELKKKYKR